MSSKITAAQEQVLEAIQLNAACPISDIATATGMQTHTVQYALSRLRQQHVFQPYWVINQHLLGLTDFCLFLNPVGHHPRLVETASAILEENPRVAFAMQLAGAYLFSVSCFGSDITVVDDLLTKLRSRIPHVRWELQFAIRLEWSIVARGYLSATDCPASFDQTISRRICGERVECDSKDLALLSALSNLPDAPIRKVAVVAGMPEATARLRFSNLQERGVLIGRPCAIRAGALGRKSYRISISSSTRDEALDDAFRDFGKQHSAISDFVVCIGAWDYEYNIQVSDPLEISETIDLLYREFPNQIQNIQTMSDVRVIKLHKFDAIACMSAR